MKILMIGGTGFLSSQIVDKLLSANHQVTILTRGISEKKIPAYKNLFYETGNRNDVRVLKELSSKHFDAVYDMIAYKPEESETAAKIFSGNINRFIHCSTISVYMISNEVHAPVTEDQWGAEPMEYWRTNPFGMDYGIDKRECEKILWKYHNKKKLSVSIMRPTFICGPGDPAKRDCFWVERILDGKPLLVPGSGDYAFQNVFVEDAASAFVSILENERSIGEAYNVAAEEIFSMNDYLNALFKILNRSSEIVHVEQKLFFRQSFSVSAFSDLFPYNVQRTSIFSLDKIKNHLNYRSTPFNEWMIKTIDWYTNIYQGHSNGYERREDEIDFIGKLKNLKIDL